jgi:hypothetical protein
MAYFLSLQQEMRVFFIAHRLLNPASPGSSSESDPTIAYPLLRFPGGTHTDIFSIHFGGSS